MGQLLLWCLILVALPGAMIALIWALFWSPQPSKPPQGPI